MGGTYEGLALLVDDETGTYWDHVTGRGLYGPLAGEELEVVGLQMTTAREALREHPDLELSRARPRSLVGRIYEDAYSERPRTVLGRLFARMRGGGDVLGGRHRLPPGFGRTMRPVDPRRPDPMEHGLGVVIAGRARYYPKEALRDGLVERWGGRALRLGVGDDRVPFARWEDDGSRPFQIFTRWYGFSATFPRCEVLGEP